MTAPVQRAADGWDCRTSGQSEWALEGDLKTRVTVSMMEQCITGVGKPESNLR
ncbi:MAG: hypothetical protein J6J42_14295 [Lachnospiraceae bacterium]|nr:hypothetical protein [Lachnospiraceae bacterium]